MVSDFMRSATAIVAGADWVDGVTAKERGFVEIRVDESLRSSSVCLPRVVEGASP